MRNGERGVSLQTPIFNLQFSFFSFQSVSPPSLLLALRFPTSLSPAFTFHHTDAGPPSRRMPARLKSHACIALP
jgi:hypothetical protein